MIFRGLRARAGCGLVAVVVVACSDPGDPQGMIRLTVPDVIESAVGPGAAAVAGGDLDLGSPWRRVDGLDSWRYFRAANELGDGPIVSGGKRPPGSSDLRDSELILPPGFGAALWMPVEGGTRLRLEARGTFGADSRLALTVVGLSGEHGAMPERIEPGSIRRMMAEERVGVARNLAHRSAGRAVLEMELERGVRTVLLLAVSAGVDVERLAEVSLHRLTGFEWLVSNDLVARDLTARVDLFGVAHHGIVMTQGDAVTTIPLRIAGDHELRWSIARVGSVDPAAQLVVTARVGGVERTLRVERLERSNDDWTSRVIPLGDVAGDVAQLSLRFEASAPDAMVCLGSPRLQRRAPPPAPSRVVLVSIDTLRADRLGCYGNRRGLTPNIDRFARSATRFARAYAHAPYTLPSHVSLFSGMLPDAHGVEQNRDRIADGVPLLQEEVAAAGFRTAAFTAGGYLSSAFGHGRGFDQYCEVDPLGDQYLTGSLRGGPRLGDGGAGSLARALEFLTGDSGDRSYLLLHTFLVHCYLPPADLLDEFGLRDDALPPLDFESARRFEPERVARDGLDEIERRWMLDGYDATVKAADRMVGRLLDCLRDHDLYDESIVVITSDHGQELLERGGAGHGVTLYEELIHVPLLIRVPGRGEGRVVESRVRHIDVVPTILDLLGRTVPPAVQGESLATAFDGASLRDRVVVARVDDPLRSRRRAVIQNGFKRIESTEDPTLPFRPRAAVELYDLDHDPNEDANLAGEREDIGGALERTLRDRERRSQQRASEVGASGGRGRAGVDDEVDRLLKELGYGG